MYQGAVKEAIKINYGLIIYLSLFLQENLLTYYSHRVLSAWGKAKTITRKNYLLFIKVKEIKIKRKIVAMAKTIMTWSYNFDFWVW